MKNLRRVCLRTCIALALLSLPLSAAPIGEREIFESFIRNNAKTRPMSFSCRITGEAITKSLERIPAEARTGQPEVHTYFQRGRGQVIRVQNADEYFRNMFSSYQAYLAMTGAWILDRGADWASFSREYVMKLIGEDSQSWAVRISRRGDDEGSHAVFRFARADASVQSVEFYNAKLLVYSVANEYGAVGAFSLPVAMTITSYRDGRVQSASRLIFSGYRVNTPIPEEIFLR